MSALFFCKQQTLQTAAEKELIRRNLVGSEAELKDWLKKTKSPGSSRWSLSKIFQRPLGPHQDGRPQLLSTAQDVLPCPGGEGSN